VKVVDFEIWFEELTGRSEKLERLTRLKATASELLKAQVGEEVKEYNNDGKHVRCASPADPHCLSRRRNGCCGDLVEPNSSERESISASGKNGRKSRKQSSHTGTRKAGTHRRDGIYVSGAAELACVLLFGHTLKELLDSDPSDRSR
jgi:hypothetical protein